MSSNGSAANSAVAIGARSGELLARVAEGDQSAFAELYDLMASRVLGSIRRLLLDSAQSEEVAQEVFLEVWQSAPTFDAQRGSAAGWIITMAKRRAIDRIRASQSAHDRDIRIGTRDLQPVDDVAETAEIAVERERADRAMQSLSDVQRQVIALAYDGGYSHSEISELLQVPIGTVKTRLRDGMIRLRTEMGVSA
ncbi:ECF RNA polymerase sigma factor SigK [Microbacterium sp. STN6]|uniref:ECF RNA polymerase sigma factor SigK n=1 Tax=Microbacterium sp. STN6 TaxID=2995588 RepID=UPI002260E292|nr:ECF RNA polymerase sigma factor SigK [Microbacterium sp. STN6]MCX7520756.1 ECF RNA polymerase sigma factor SigK [Microbacterium sp. STN6]